MLAVENIALEIESEVKHIRHTLHKIPELGFHEYKTSQYIQQKLKEWDIPYKVICKTGVIGTISGQSGGKNLLLRADMDALPIHEESTVPFLSEHNGYMHACGHDIHIACLLGAAKILNQLKETFCGSIQLVFQPDEEGEGGALPMIEQGILKNPKIDAALALHVEPLEDCGKIQVKYGPIMASPDNFYITVHGKGGHGAYPNECVDPIITASMIVTAYQNIVSRYIDPMIPCAVSVCELKAGTCPNVIPDTAYISGTARSLDYDTREKLIFLLEKIATDISCSMGARIEYRFEKLYPPLINNDAMNDLIVRAGKQLKCVKDIVYLKNASMAGDDFAYFAQEVPSAYFKLGVGNPDKKKRYAIHSPKFEANEDAFITGMSVMAQAALDYLAVKE